MLHLFWRIMSCYCIDCFAENFIDSAKAVNALSGRKKSGHYVVYTESVIHSALKGKALVPCDFSFSFFLLFYDNDRNKWAKTETLTPILCASHYIWLCVYYNTLESTFKNQHQFWSKVLKVDKGSLAQMYLPFVIDRIQNPRHSCWYLVCQFGNALFQQQQKSCQVSSFYIQSFSHFVAFIGDLVFGHLCCTLLAG